MRTIRTVGRDLGAPTRRAARARAGALLAGVMVASVALALAGPARAADEPVPAPAAPPFAGWADELTPGAPLRVPGLVLVPLLRPVEKQQPLEGARVGLGGVPIDVLDLPDPAGEFYVRVTNRSAAPVEVTAGEALVTPGGTSRVALRDAYLPPHGSTLVATARGQSPTPRGPYVARGLGLSPREHSLLETERWPLEVVLRNRAFAVAPDRESDATSAYLTEAFEAQAAGVEQALKALTAPQRVGVVVFDERGACFARIAPDAERFRQNLGFLGRALALDALRAAAAGRLPQDGTDVQIHARVQRLLEVLRQTPVSRAGFAGAEVHRWDAFDQNGRWHGLSVAGAPWSLTWCQRAPQPPPAPVPRPQPPTPPQPPPTPPPTPNEVDRRPRPSAFDERFRERR